MKNSYRLFMLFVLCTGLILQAFAQEKQTSSSNFTTNFIDELLNKNTGEAIELSLPSGISFKGVIVSNEVKFGTLHVCIARSVENSGTILQYFKRTNEDKSVVYGGKLMTEQAVHFLQPGAEGRMAMQTKNKQEVLQDCAAH
jgi:hypothetical protein